MKIPQILRIMKHLCKIDEVSMLPAIIEIQNFTKYKNILPSKAWKSEKQPTQSEKDIRGSTAATVCDTVNSASSHQQNDALNADNRNNRLQLG